MNTRIHLPTLSLLAVFAFGACADSGLTPLVEEDILALEDQVALEILEDDVAIEATLELAELRVMAGARHGAAHSAHQAATQLAAEARVRFRTAQDELHQGNRERAANEARVARRLIAEAMTTVGGPRAAWSLVERFEEMTTSVTEDPDAYTNASALLGELSTFANRARARLKNGDGTGAGALGVLAQQRHQHQQRRDVDPAARHDRARLAVALAGTAVSLATRILDEQGADDEQLRYLQAAGEYLDKAEQAFEAGNDRRAVYLARHAHWAALKALVLPGGVTEEEARAMAELAEGLYVQAVEAVGDDPTELQATLLQRSRRLIDAGLTKLADGEQRGIGALWKAAVVCTWLIG